jgi:hypothetical protein
MSQVAIIPAVHVLAAPAMLKRCELRLHPIRHDPSNVFYMAISSDCRHATHEICGEIGAAFHREEHGKLKTQLDISSSEIAGCRFCMLRHSPWTFKGPPSNISCCVTLTQNVVAWLERSAALFTLP